MAWLTECPLRQDLIQFSLGLTTDAEANELEQHLRDCADCVERLHSLAAQDTLTDAMRAQTLSIATRAARSEDPRQTLRIQTLIEQVTLLWQDFRVRGDFGSLSKPLSFLSPPTEPGDLGRLGQYRIRKVLGQGGMGIVFDAVDTRLQRPVALKVLRPHLAAEPAARERFVREARAAASLHHENLVPIYEVGEEAGLPFLAMQLMAGESLESRCQREGRLPLDEVSAIGRQIASGLAAAHERGLVHRDIKPANIWLDSCSAADPAKPQAALVKILDFGLARAVAEDARLTQPGVLLGTPLFMAPEQADGQAVDARADLFSLGSVLYLLCGGTPAFEADSTMAVLRAVCDKEPRPIQELNPDVPDCLAAVIAKLHAKKPEHRYQSAPEVVKALKTPEVAATSGVSRRRRLRIAWAAAIVLACVGLGLTEATGVTQLRSLLAPANSGASRGSPESAVASVNGAPQRQPVLPIVQQEEPKVVVVAAALFPFEERGVKDLGVKISDLLFVKLAGHPKLLLVDRADLKKTLAEQALNLSGAVRPDQAVQVGQLTGAKLLITGSIIHIDKNIHLVAKVVGTETSQVVGTSVEGKSSDELGPLVEQLADKLADLIAKQSDMLIAKAVPAKDRIAAVKQQLKDAARPSVWVHIAERHVGAPSLDPAAQTEVLKFCNDAGFTIIDTEVGFKGKADVIIKGEGLSETATRVGGLVSVRARVDLKAVDRQTGKVLAVDRQTVIVVDLSEQLAGKAALQEAAAMVAERVLPKLMKGVP